MTCSLASVYQKLSTGSHTTMRIHVDTAQLQDSGASELLVEAHVTSSGNESDASDNSDWQRIALIEFSTVELNVKSSVPAVSLQTGLDVLNVTHTLEVRNTGPSSMPSGAVVEVLVPHTYVHPWSLVRLPVFDWLETDLTVSWITGCVSNVPCD